MHLQSNGNKINMLKKVVDSSISETFNTFPQIFRNQLAEFLGLLQKKLIFVGVCTAFLQSSGKGSDHW